MGLAAQLDWESDLASRLISGGDSRLALNPRSGVNKYFCPPLPALNIACFSSCTASPISIEGARAARETLARLCPRGRTTADPAVLDREASHVAAQLRSLLGVDDIAEIFLTPSGTDATMLLTGLLATERPGVPIVSIMAAAAETGAEVPLAAAGRHFSEITAAAGSVPFGEPVFGLPGGMRTIAVPLRRDDGTARPIDEIDAEFDRAVSNTAGRPIVHLMEGSKTGLRAPGRVPTGAEVVVDACQARVPPKVLRGYLERGWPVLVTGSKFYGGPSFCGAILFPAKRLGSIDFDALPAGLAAYCSAKGSRQPAASIGSILRWSAALDAMVRFAVLKPPEVSASIASLSDRIIRRLASTPGIVPVSMPPDSGNAEAWPRSIHTFAVRDPATPSRFLSMSELQMLYRQLAGVGVLVGQPVAIGARFGGLRVAVGARTLLDPHIEANLDRLSSAIRHLTQSDDLVAAE